MPTVSIRALSILITVVLNSQSDNSYLLAIFEYVQSLNFVSSDCCNFFLMAKHIVLDRRIKRTAVNRSFLMLGRALRPGSIYLSASLWAVSVSGAAQCLPPLCGPGWPGQVLPILR